jgi:hypothetical protein
MKICKKKTTKESNPDYRFDLFENKIEPLLISLGFSNIDNDNRFFLSSEKDILIQYDLDNGDLSISRNDVFCKNSFYMIIDRISYAFLKKTLKKIM